MTASTCLRNTVVDGESFKSLRNSYGTKINRIVNMGCQLHKVIFEQIIDDYVEERGGEKMELTSHKKIVFEGTVKLPFLISLIIATELTPNFMAA